MERGADLQSKALFPLFVDMSEWHVVVIGGGAIATRRIKALVPFAGHIAVYAPQASAELLQLSEAGVVSLAPERYDARQLQGANMVLACTNDDAINDAIWADCKRLGILVNVCSDRTKCDFHFPGIVREGNVVVGVNAGGVDHKGARLVREQIQELLGGREWS